jgi:hypothetical protein
VPPPRPGGARAELGTKFEELSVVERLTERHVATHTTEQLRRAYVDLDETGMQRKNLEAKE